MMTIDAFWSQPHTDVGLVPAPNLEMMDIIDSSDVVLAELGEPISPRNMDGAVLKGLDEVSSFMANGGKCPLKVTSLRMVDGQFAIGSCFILGGDVA